MFNYAFYDGVFIQDNLVDVFKQCLVCEEC